MAQKPAPPLNSQQFPSKPLYLPHCFRLFPSTSSPLDSYQLPPQPLSAIPT
jgi:hypothetical protein